MSIIRRQQAVILRKKGASIKAIALQLQAAQSSVSIWVREVKLTQEQTMRLRSNTHTPEVIERRRQSRLNSELAKRTAVIKAAKREITMLSRRELWLIGTALYWAEGSKTQRTVQFANGDIRMVLLMLRYFREICEVDETKIRGCIHIHESLDVQAAESYWIKATGIAANKFYKTYNKPNKASKGLRHSLPNGVCNVYVLDAKLLLKIKGWIEGIYEKSVSLPFGRADKSIL